VRRAVEQLGVGYPVALDNDYAVWTAFDNHYWPAVYLADAQGRIRHHHFGEGEYDSTEMILQHLLKEAGAEDLDTDLVSVDAVGLEAEADWDSLWSPENYLGSDRTENFASPNGAVLGARHIYKPPTELRLNQWALTGDWTMEREAVVLNEAEGTIAYRFHARDVNVVMGPSERNTPVRFLVRLDGQPPGAAHGVDVDEQGRRQGRRTAAPPARPPAPPVGERTVEITFSTPASTRTRSPSAKRGHGHLGVLTKIVVGVGATSRPRSTPVSRTAGSRSAARSTGDTSARRRNSLLPTSPGLPACRTASC
jgi:Thioredoxin like C-terminal domain